MLGLGLSLTTGGVATPAYVVLAKAFVSRVEADGGTVDSFACLKTDMAYLTSNPDAPAGYTVEWSSATVGSSAEFRINLVGGAGYTYTYAVTDTQATEVTGTGVIGGDIQAVTADLSTLVDGTVTLAVYLTGAGGDGNVVTDTANLVGYTGLLDTYSGAAAAYSLRLLDTSYTGDAIVVRRASDNTTQAIGFVNNELDTTSLESFCSGTDGFVTTWYDQSGNSVDATQGSAAAQPQIVSSGSTILENGKPTLDFDSSSSQDFNVSITINTTAYSNFIVEASDDTANTSTQMMYGVSTSVFYTRLRSLDLESRVSSSPIINLDDDFAYTTSQQYLISIINGASQGAHYIDGTIGNKSPNDTSTSGGINESSLNLGSSNGAFYFNGKIQEMVFYFNDESSNRSGIETNINDFYSIY